MIDFNELLEEFKFKHIDYNLIYRIEAKTKSFLDNLFHRHEILDFSVLNINNILILSYVDGYNLEQYTISISDYNINVIKVK